MPARVRCDDLQLFAMGKEQRLLTSASGESSYLPTAIARLLGACTSFAEPADHVRRHWEALGWARRAELVRESFRYCLERRLDPPLGAHWLQSGLTAVLDHLRERGMLLSEDDLLARAHEHAGSPTGGLVTRIGLPTRNRPKQLARAVESYVANLTAHGRTPTVLVSDDTADPQSRLASRATLADISRRSGITIAYAGPEEKRAFAARLVARGLPPDVVEFALFDPEECLHTTGANRNSLLMECAGEMLLSVDDDTVCRLAPCPTREPGLTVSSDNDMSWWFFQSRDEALAAAAQRDCDLLGLHERALGRTPAECFEVFRDEGVKFETLSTDLMRRVAGGRGRIAMSSCSWLGDSGAEPAGLFHIDDESLSRATASPELFDKARGLHDVIRSPARYLVTDSRFCMSTFIGLDNRVLLPPFMPVGRVQDAVFGVLLRRARCDSLTVTLPWTLLHDPPGRRHGGGGGTSERALVSIARVVMLAIESGPENPGQQDAETQLGAIGAHLSALGEADPDAFDELVRFRLGQFHSSRIGALEEVLARNPAAPRFWKQEMTRGIASYRASLLEPSAFVPAYPGTRWDLAKRRRVTQRLVGRFGELLAAWPEMIRTARELRDRGKSLFRAILPS